MRGAERVVLALRALGEAGEPAFLAQRAHAVAAAGEDLVRIGLVADVPDQPVARRVEHVMQRHGQLDHAEPGAEMAAGVGDDLDQVVAQLRRQFGQRASGRRRRSAGTLMVSRSGVLEGCVTFEGLLSAQFKRR